MPEFLILRNAAARSTVSGLESFGPAMASVAPTPPVPRVETHDISLREAVSAARDPDAERVPNDAPAS